MTPVYEFLNNVEPVIGGEWAVTTRSYRVDGDPERYAPITVTFDRYEDAERIYKQALLLSGNSDVYLEHFIDDEWIPVASALPRG